MTSNVQLPNRNFSSPCHVAYFDEISIVVCFYTLACTREKWLSVVPPSSFLVNKFLFVLQQQSHIRTLRSLSYWPTKASTSCTSSQTYDSSFSWQRFYNLGALNKNSSNSWLHSCIPRIAMNSRMKSSRNTNVTHFFHRSLKNTPVAPHWCFPAPRSSLILLLHNSLQKFL